MKRSLSDASLWMGIDFFAWARLLIRNRCAVSLWRLPQVILITLVAVLNTCLRWAELARFGSAVRAIELHDDPVFIIGHWRTGTTMLHELLALDPRHRCPTTYESLAPNHILLSERLVRRFARRLLPRTRPFDNMRMSFDRPQEDEAALSLRGQPSPFLTVAFPRRAVQDPPYITLEGLTPRQLSAWKARLTWYLRLLLYKRPGRLVLKSPQHTFRIPVLQEMFPRAKFIHLVRDPFAVYPSTVHFWRTMYDRYGLQGYDLETLEERVLATFAEMHTRLEATREHIDAERFYELKYEDLVDRPIAQLESLYKSLELGDFTACRPAVEEYAQRSLRYRTNQYELDAATRAKIHQRWSAYIEKYGYANTSTPASSEARAT